MRNFYVYWKVFILKYNSALPTYEVEQEREYIRMFLGNLQINISQLIADSNIRFTLIDNA